jgi:hypothetical protein
MLGEDVLVINTGPRLVVATRPCIEAGSEMGELVVRRLGSHPRVDVQRHLAVGMQDVLRNQAVRKASNSSAAVRCRPDGCPRVR